MYEGKQKIVQGLGSSNLILGILFAPLMFAGLHNYNFFLHNIVEPKSLQAVTNYMYLC